MLVAGLVGVGGVLVAEPAQAAIVETTTVVTSQVPIPEYGKATAADQKTILKISPTLAAGGRYYLRGRWTVTSSASQATMQGTFVQCYLAGTSPSTDSRSVFTTRNHVPPLSSTSMAEVRWAFTPTESGTYVCELKGYAYRLDLGTGNRYFTTVSGASNTYLFTNDSGFPDLEEWRNDIAGPMNGSYKDLYTMRKTFTPRPDTTMLRAHSDLEATVIRVAPLQTTTWKVTMYVTQLNSVGTGCSAPVRTYSKTVSLDPSIVHWKTYIWADVPIYSSATYSDCIRRFALKTRVNYVSGLDLRLETTAYSNALAWSFIG